MAEYVYYKSGGKIYPILNDGSDEANAAIAQAEALRLERATEEEGRKRRLMSEYKDSPIAAAALGLVQVPTIGMGAGLLEKTGLIEPGTTEAIAEQNPITYYGTDVIGSLFGPMLLRGGAKAISYGGRILDDAGVVGGKIAKGAGELAEKGAEKYLKYAPDQRLSDYGARVQDNLAQQIIARSTNNAKAAQTMGELVVPIAGRGVVEGAAYGAGYGINEELITDPDATAGEILASGFTGALEGAVLGPLFSLAISGGLGATALSAKKSVDVASAVYKDMIDKHGDKFSSAIGKIFVHGGDKIRGQFEKVFSEITSGQLNLQQYVQKVADVESFGSKIKAITQKFNLEDQLLQAEAKGVASEKRRVKSGIREVERRGVQAKEAAESRIKKEINALKKVQSDLRKTAADEAFVYKERRFESAQVKADFDARLDVEIAQRNRDLERILEVSETEVAKLKFLGKRTQQLKAEERAAAKEGKAARRLSFSQEVDDIDTWYTKEIEGIQEELVAKQEAFRAIQDGFAADAAGVKEKLAKEISELQSDAVDAKLSRDIEIVNIDIDEQEFRDMTLIQKEYFADRLASILEEHGEKREVKERVAEQFAKLDASNKLAIEDANRGYAQELDAVSKQLDANEKLQAKTVTKLAAAVNEESDKLNKEATVNAKRLQDSVTDLYKKLGLPYFDATKEGGIEAAAKLKFSHDDVRNNPFGKLLIDAFNESNQTVSSVQVHLEEFSEYVLNLVKSLSKMQNLDSIPGNQQAFARLAEMAEGLIAGAPLDPVKDAAGKVIGYKPQADSLIMRIKNFNTQLQKSPVTGVKQRFNLAGDIINDTVNNNRAVEAASIYLGLSKLLSELDVMYGTILGKDIKGIGPSMAIQLKTQMREHLTDSVKGPFGRVAELEHARRTISSISKYKKGYFDKIDAEKAKELETMATDALGIIKTQEKPTEVVNPFTGKKTKKKITPVMESIGAIKGDLKKVQKAAADVQSNISMAADYRSVLDEFNDFMKYDFVASDDLYPRIESLLQVRPSQRVQQLAGQFKRNYEVSGELRDTQRDKLREVQEGREIAIEQSRLTKQHKAELKADIKKLDGKYKGFQDFLKKQVAETNEIDSTTFAKFAEARADAEADFQTVLQSISEFAKAARLSAREEQELIYQAARARRNADSAAIAELRNGIKGATSIRQDSIGTARATLNEDLVELTRLEHEAIRELDDINNQILTEIGEKQAAARAAKIEKEQVIKSLRDQKKDAAMAHRQRVLDIDREALDTKQELAYRLREGDDDIADFKEQLLDVLEKIEQDTHRQVKPAYDRLDELAGVADRIEADRIALAQGKSKAIEELQTTAVDQDIRDLLAYRQRDRFGSVANAFGLEALTNAMGSLIPAPVAVGLYSTFKLMDNPRDVLRIAAGVYGISKFTGEVIQKGADNMLKVVRGAKADKYEGRRSVLARALGLTVRANVDPSSYLTDEEYEELVMDVDEKLNDPAFVERTTELAQGKFVGVEKLKDPMANTVAMGMQVLSQAMPQLPDEAAFDRAEFVPTPEDKTKLRDAYFAVADPIGAFYYLAANNQLTPQFINNLMQVYPKLLPKLLGQTVESLQGEAVPYDTQVSLSLATQAPLTSTMDPTFVGALQQNISQPPAGQEQQGGVNMTQGGVGKLSKSAATYETPGQRMMGA